MLSPICDPKPMLFPAEAGVRGYDRDTHKLFLGIITCSIGSLWTLILKSEPEIVHYVSVAYDYIQISINAFCSLNENV